MQHVYPLELSCDTVVCASTRDLNVDAPVFRPKLLASLRAEERIHQIAKEEENVG